MHCCTHLPKNETMRKRTRWGLRRGKERGDATTWIRWKRVRRIAVGDLCFQCGNIVPERHTSHVECQSQVGSQQHSTANAFLFTEAYQHFCDCCKLQFQRATVTQNRAVEEDTIQIQLSIYIRNHRTYIKVLWLLLAAICRYLCKIGKNDNSVHSGGLLEILPPKHHCPKQGVQEAVACHPRSNIADCKAKGRSNTCQVEIYITNLSKSM